MLKGKRLVERVIKALKGETRKKYIQTTGAVRKECDGRFCYCVVGVLYDAAGCQWAFGDDGRYPNDIDVYMSQVLGMDLDGYDKTIAQLVYWNDLDRLSFRQIARRLPKLVRDNGGGDAA